MPPKRPSPLEDPPSASATSSGEETEDEEEVQATDAEEEEEEVGSEEEEEPEEPKPTQPSRPIPKSKPIPKPQSPNDSDDASDASDEEKVNLADDSGSDSDSDNENGPVKHMIAPRNADVKPISSKPMNLPEPPPKPKKPTSTPTPISAPKNSSAAKRPLETEKKDKRDRKKKKVADIEDEEETEKKGGGEDKKNPNPIQRIWSEEDEILLLKGLIDYKKKGFDPFNNHLNGFLDMIKNSLHVENLKNHQLLNKVQRLRQKYLKNASRAKPGEDPVISRPHELNSYQLSKLIWSDKDEGVEANHIGSESVKTEVKKSKNQVSSNGVASSPKRKVTKVAANSPKVVVDYPKVAADSPKVENSSQKVERKEEDTRSGSEFLFLNGSVQSHSIPLMPVPPQGLGEIFAKKGWNSIKNLNAGTLDQRWKAMLIAETQVYLDRLELVRDQTKGMLDALMSSEF